MPYHELMKLSRDAAKRAREAIAAEKARGGPGADARAMAAAAPALDEIKVLSDTIGRYRNIEDSLEDRNGRLRRLRQDSYRPPDVKRRQLAQLQTEIDELESARRDWEREVRARLLPASTPAGEDAIGAVRRDASTAVFPETAAPERKAVADTDDAGLPAPPKGERDLIGDTDDAGLVDPETRKRQAIADTDDAGLIDAEARKRKAVASTDDAGLIDPDAAKGKAVADMDDAGLVGLEDMAIDIGQLAAMRPRTYDEFMRIGTAIGEVAGFSRLDKERLGTVLSELHGIEREIANAPAGPDGGPDERQRGALERARKEAEAYYAGYVKKALARRNTPLDVPRSQSGAVDMTLVQPGFVYRTKDGKLFMIDPDRRKFVEARKTSKARAGGVLYAPADGGETVSVRAMRLRADGIGPAVTHRMPAGAQGKVSAANLEKGAVYEVEDGTTFRWDGERFREVYWDARSKAWLARKDPAKGFWNAGVSDLSEEAEYDRDALAIGRETGFRFAGDIARIGTLAKEMKGVRERLEAILDDGLPTDDQRINRLKKRLDEGMARLRDMHAELVEKARPEMLDLKAMGGRMDDPGRLGHARNRSLRTVGEFGAKLGEAWSVQRARSATIWKGYFDRIDAGEDLRVLWDQIHDPKTREILKEYHDIPSLRASHRRLYVPFLDARASGVYRWAQKWRDVLEAKLPLNSRFEGEFFADILPKALSDAAAKTTISMALQPLGFPAPFTQAMLGMIDESATQFRAALKRKVPLDDAYEIFGFGGFVGLSEGLPVAAILEKLNVATGGMADDLLWQAFKGYAEGKAVEEVKAALTRNINKGLEEAKQLEVASDAEINAAAASNGVALLVLTMLGKDEQLGMGAP